MEEKLRAIQLENPRLPPKWVAAMGVPFLDESPMIGPAPWSAKHFQQPRLRRCTMDPSTLAWESRLGGGLDGYVWKVWFGDAGPFALKLFWDNPPDFFHYFAAQRECHNSAIFQMIEASMAQAAADSRSIHVHANPQTQNEALDNQFAFSDENLAQSSQADSKPASPSTIDPESPNSVPITSMPRLRECYGWMKLPGEIFHDLPMDLCVQPYTVSKVKRSVDSREEYIAVIYEYIEEGGNDPFVVEEVDRFFWLTGFCHTVSPAARNWKSGVLIDLADMIDADGFEWDPTLYRPWKASWILKE
ncbi:hypothetical protein EDB80DRAFT_751445 [Ilyonectria destructans]|nr:hypothetical protein EDB80DRAFT_751445 [Ilyonectria destructans]